MNRRTLKRHARNVAGVALGLARVAWAAAYIGLGYIVSDERDPR